MSTYKYSNTYLANTAPPSLQQSAEIDTTIAAASMIGGCVRLLESLDAGSTVAEVWVGTIGQFPTVDGSGGGVIVDQNQRPFMFVGPPPPPLITYAFVDCCLTTASKMFLAYVATSTLPVTDLRWAITDGSTLTSSGAAATDCNSAGAIMVTNATTAYALYTPNGTLGVKILKGTSLTTAPSWASNTVTTTTSVTSVLGGLAKVGSNLVALLYDSSAHSLQLYTSGDDGVTWTPGTTLQQSGNVSSNGAMSMQFYSENGVHAWAVAYYNSSDNKVHIQISRDNGSTWTDTVVGTPTSTPTTLWVYVATSSHFLVQWTNISTVTPTALESYDAVGWTTPANQLGFGPTGSVTYSKLSRLTNQNAIASAGFDGNIGTAITSADVIPASTVNNYGQYIQLSTTEVNYNPDDFISSTEAGGVAWTQRFEHTSSGAAGASVTTDASYSSSSAGGSCRVFQASLSASASGGPAVVTQASHTTSSAGGPGWSQNHASYLASAAGGPGVFEQIIYAPGPTGGPAQTQTTTYSAFIVGEQRSGLVIGESKIVFNGITYVHGEF